MDTGAGHSTTEPPGSMLWEWMITNGVLYSYLTRVPCASPLRSVPKKKPTAGFTSNELFTNVSHVHSVDSRLQTTPPARAVCAVCVLHTLLSQTAETLPSVCERWMGVCPKWQSYTLVWWLIPRLHPVQPRVSPGGWDCSHMAGRTLKLGLINTEGFLCVVSLQKTVAQLIREVNNKWLVIKNSINK